MTDAARERLLAIGRRNAAARMDMDSKSGRFDRLRDRHANGAAPQAVSAFQLFQTPSELAERLLSLLSPASGCRILEPSAGLGRLIDAALPYQPSEIVAVEIAAECARVLFNRATPGVRLYQRDFLGVHPSEIGAVDLVAMNPPFKNGIDIAHVKHALRFLRPNGVLGAFCYDGPRQNDQLRKLAETTGGEWLPLGPGHFVPQTPTPPR